LNPISDGQRSRKESRKRSGVTLPSGFTAAGVHCGIKKKKLDLAVLYSKDPCVAAGVFTENKFKAAPVLVTSKRVDEGQLRAVVVNSGNANALTGDSGLDDASEMATETAACLGLSAAEVAVASTGVIGVPMPMERIKKGIKEACSLLSSLGGGSAARAIMTTDTVPKETSVSFSVSAGTALSSGAASEKVDVTIGGMAKGSGMIRPNLATLLCFLTTDAAITKEALDKALKNSVEHSFNMIAVDNDMSTNDMVLVLANGTAGNAVIQYPSADYNEFEKRLKDVCIHLAKWVVRDGEGATKFIEINVRGARTFQDAKTTALSVACSSLVKTAMFGGDPNWGRILAAVGYSNAFVDPHQVDLWIGPVQVVRDGTAAEYSETSAKKTLSGRDISVFIDLKLGEADATVWTCDLSYDYVKVNGSYRS
jgi:glutamate N-acetyltransferase/amino-acid N-acetyltransferase